MSYKSYLDCCKQGQLWASRQGALPDLDPVKLSELYILSGNEDSARGAIENISDHRAKYLQSVKAGKHFDAPSFFAGLGLPPAGTSDWVLPLLRAASSIAGASGNAEELGRYATASPRVSGADAVRALLIVSNAYRNSNDIAQSERVLLEAFQLGASVVPPVPPGLVKKIDLAFARRRQAAFHDMLQAVDFKGCSAFPCSGTLLGLHRDGDFIPSDGDVDIGCLDPDGFERMKVALRSAGRFYVSPGRLGTNINVRHIDGTKIDISLYVPRGERWAKTSHVYEWQFDRFTLGMFATDYGRLPAPEPVESYLSAMYEDWWVPRSGYDSRIDSPNLSYVSREEVVMVLASHFLLSRMTEGEASGRKWLAKLRRLPEDMRSSMGRFVDGLK